MPDPVAPAPAGGLLDRTFLGLLVAQFFAAFNDQAIHAAAMFYAIDAQVLTEENAITLMPILFYSPWAIFCTVAGYFADKFSKRTALVFWKVAEVAICAVALLGFWLGRNGEPALGPWLVLGTVFLMGTHSAFFVPAKYGIMPEILPPSKLSKGNGLLESLSFLAVILGTVSGGVMSYLFKREEWIIGAILVGLAVFGALASLLIRTVPATNPLRSFPPYIYGPLLASVRTLRTVPALRLVLRGLIFFTFVVAFMRAAVYMLGESQNPRWDELKTSVIVGTVALGIGIGSPLAGWLSGRRIELRLVVAGAAGMVFALLAAGFFIDRVPILVGCIIAIGFFTGFYIVPLFTLLQAKAPKQSKGEMIATSNCVNVTGAIAATLLFKVVVAGAHATGLTPVVADRTPVASGRLTELGLARGRPVYFELETAAGVVTAGTKPAAEGSRTLGEVVRHILDDGGPTEFLEVDKAVPVPPNGAAVDVSKFTIAGVTHFDLVLAGQPPSPDYDNRHLPRFLFIGAAAFTGLLLVSILRPVRRLGRELRNEV